MQGALQRAVAENPELAQQEPALLKLANKVTYISISVCPSLLSMLLSGCKEANLQLQSNHLLKISCTQGRAADIKVKGNTAFAAGKFDEAVAHFTSCIKLDSE